MTRIKEIEERLEKASPGPWHACDERKLLGEKISLSNQITALKAELADALTNQDARRMSLAQEIAEALKVRGHWVPKDYASAELINAVGMALDELADARGRLEKCLDAIEEIRGESTLNFHPPMLQKSINEAWDLWQAIKGAGGSNGQES